MNKTTLNSQKEKHSMLSLRRATRRGLSLPCRRRYFYPRSPCGERRCLRWCASISSRQFLSTLSLRRATPPTRPPTPQQYNFYPRSPCGERRQPISTGCPGGPISIHALLAESDLLCQGDSMEPKIFLSTLSLRRATAAGPVDVSGVEISIHALLAESDWATAFHFRSRRQFLSTLSLRRATTDRQEYVVKAVEFLSTLSLRRATNMLAPISDPATQFLSTLSLRRATTAS